MGSEEGFVQMEIGTQNVLEMGDFLRSFSFKAAKLENGKDFNMSNITNNDSIPITAWLSNIFGLSKSL